jgi:hypothetical protein
MASATSSISSHPAALRDVKGERLPVFVLDALGFNSMGFCEQFLLEFDSLASEMRGFASESTRIRSASLQPA